VHRESNSTLRVHPGWVGNNGRDEAMFPLAEAWNLRHSLAGPGARHVFNSNVLLRVLPASA
jgi:hypothetical protein